MQIPPKQYQFDDERALLITTGKQTGRIFFARKGTIKEVDEAFIPTPKYSDDEGFFARSGRGGNYGAGAVRESKDVETKHKFTRVISDKIRKAIADNKVQSIYLFSPNYEITELKAALPREAEEMIRYSFMGNFVRFAPEMLLQKISDKMAARREKNTVRKTEEVKILAKPAPRTTNKLRKSAAKVGKSSS